MTWVEAEMKEREQLRKALTESTARVVRLEALLRQCASWIEHAEDDRPEDRKECAKARAKLIRGALVHDELLPGR